MGMGACAVEARTAASLGALSAVAPDFQPTLDVPNGGVLCALPALLAVGLLDSAKRFFTLPKGYYGLDTLFLLLAFMALARLNTLESLRHSAPGEWGKLLGLDRAPAYKCRFSHPPPPAVQNVKFGPLTSGKLGHPSGRPALTGRS